MANKIKVHNTSGISSQKKASLTPANASLNDGLFNSHIVEDITFENITVQGKKLNNTEQLKLFTQFGKNIKFN
jgi:hypothetical protein